MDKTSATASLAGLSEEAASVLGRRSLHRHGAFLVPYLQPGLSVLDCGCGPGSMTCDIAKTVKSGLVVGIDVAPDRVDAASGRASSLGISNVSFQVASIYSLPFTDEAFDIVFAHAVFQHLSEPRRALAEIRRVLRPGGRVALRSPDWGALFVAPRTPDLLAAIDQFVAVYYAQGDAFAGSLALGYLDDLGFVDTHFSASGEHEVPKAFGEFAASHVEGAGLTAPGGQFRRWADSPGALFAQGWGEVVGRKAR